MMKMSIMKMTILLSQEINSPNHWGENTKFYFGYSCSYIQRKFNFKNFYKIHSNWLFTVHRKKDNICSSTYLPMRRNSPSSACRLMAIRMLRTVMPSQKHTTTLALGRWALSLSSNRSKLCSPALLQILPGKMYNAQAKCFTYKLYSMVIKSQMFIG